MNMYERVAHIHLPRMQRLRHRPGHRKVIRGKRCLGLGDGTILSEVGRQSLGLEVERDSGGSGGGGGDDDGVGGDAYAVRALRP